MTYDISDRDYGHFLLGDDFDLDAQLRAIHWLLAHHGTASEMASRELEEINSAAARAYGAWADHLVDMSVDQMHGSVYRDAAHSMAAAGMIAPLLETVATRIFKSIGARTHWPLADQKRRGRAGANKEGFWNPQIYFSGDGEQKRDMVCGLPQLGIAAGLSDRLPSDFIEAFEALMQYRNRMFHNGFEWPSDTRKTFATTIKDRGWETWFDWSTTNHEPWICYMTDALIARSLELVDELVDGAGKLVRAQAETNGLNSPDEIDDIPAWLASELDQKS